MKRLLFIMSLLTVFLVAGTLQLQAAPIPDGFAGVKWEQSKDVTKKIIANQGWRMVGEDARNITAKGSFNGMKAQLTYQFESNALVGGTVITGVYPKRNIAASAFAYKDLVKNLTEKYGPPTSSSEDNMAATSGWFFTDGATKDEYSIYVMFTKYSSIMDPDYPPNEELVGITVYYSASSLAKRLKNRGL